MSQDYMLIIQKLVRGLQKDKIRLIKRKYSTNALEHVEAISLELVKEKWIVSNMQVYLEQCDKIKEILKNWDCNGIVISM